MPKKKVKLAFIENNSLRKITYNKRKKSFLKKMNEITTLCGINAGAIIYSPFDNPTPVVWPSVDGMREVIHALENVMDYQKKVTNQTKFLKRWKECIDKSLQEQKRENREAQLTEFMYQCLAGNTSVDAANSEDLNDLAFIIKQFLDPLNRRIKSLGGSDMEIGESSNAAAAAAATEPSEPLGILTLAPAATTVHGVGSSSSYAAAGGGGGASFFNPMHPYPLYYPLHFYQPPPPYAGHPGLYDQPCYQNPYMGMMNLPEYMRYAPRQMGSPYMEYNPQAYYHPYQSQQHPLFPGASSTAQQHPLFPGGSSAVPPPTTSGSVTPATTSDPNNNN